MSNLRYMYLLVFLLLIAACHGLMTFIPTTTPLPNKAELQCLKASGFLDEVFITTLYNSTKHTWSPAISPSDCEKVGTTPQLVLYLYYINWLNTTVEL